MPAITGVEFRQFSANHHNAQRNWLLVKLNTDDPNVYGIGDASPMENDDLVMGMIEAMVAKHLIGKDPLESEVLWTTLYQDFQARGGRIASTALSGIDIALWDLKGKIFGQPIYKLLGGAWRTALPFYASIGGNGVERKLDDVLHIVEQRMQDKPAAIKIRFDNARVDLDSDIPDHLEKARAVRRLVGDDFPLAFDANNGYSTGGAIRVGRVLEDLGYWWFEEPVQHYHIKAMGEVAAKLSITVSAGEQTYTTGGLVELIEAGVRMIQPDIVKMGGITGLLRCAALAQAHGVELVSHQTQPMIGHLANMHVCAAQLHATKPCEWNDPSSRMHAVFDRPPRPIDGLFHLSDAPGLGIDFIETELQKRRIDL